jgi:hypothetical protein
MKVGVDLDGVLVNFIKTYIQLFRDQFGDQFPQGYNETQWRSWHDEYKYGYTPEQTIQVWDRIKDDPWFWERLDGYKTVESDLQYLQNLQDDGASIYFITDRPGRSVKGQTERWIRKHWRPNFKNPTILITNEKGLAAKILGLDFYIDDKPENCDAVLLHSPNTKVALFDQPWNQEYDVYGRKNLARVYEFDNFPYTLQVVA